MNTLSQANPFFVRCLKPNMSKVADRFDSDLVLNQLRYSGMLETVRIRRAGYPVRRLFSDFLFRCVTCVLGKREECYAETDDDMGLRGCLKTSALPLCIYSHIDI